MSSPLAVELEPRTNGRPTTPALAHLLGSDVFPSILVRERKRSDRSQAPFCLLTVQVDGEAGAKADRLWDSVIAATKDALRDTHIAGWLEWRSAIGVILPEVCAPDGGCACEQFVAVFRRALVTRNGDEALDRVPIRLHVYPEPRHAADAGVWPVDPLLHPTVARGRRHGIERAIKRGVDLAGSLSLLAALLPLLALIGLLVKVSSRGSILFNQVRIGQMTKPFTMLKFRTMYSGSDPRPHQEFVSAYIQGRGPDATAVAGEAPFKLTDDPRITPIGRFLRRTSLDELPQLWNVVRGEMSLVGPRPPLPYELGHYQSWHRRRILEAKPGVTGLWQVIGRSRTTFDEMVRLDLRYVRTRSLWTDLRILLATPVAVISGTGAR
jgi:lipopolysaccharide/colanic/teichoic acid biosynthesis glycosyltransferase